MVWLTTLEAKLRSHFTHLISHKPNYQTSLSTLILHKTGKINVHFCLI